MNIARLLSPAEWLATFMWLRALDFQARKQPEQALRVINAVSPSIRDSIHWRLLKLAQHFELGHFAAAIQQARSLIPSIQASSLTDPDKRYLTAYVKSLGAKAHGNLVAPMQSAPGYPFRPADFEFLWNDVDFECADRWLQRMFPLVAHEDG
ncbi:MAG: hypothetical protein ACREH4_01475 [Vitreimonas sp.]